MACQIALKPFNDPADRVAFHRRGHPAPWRGQTKGGTVPHGATCGSCCSTRAEEATTASITLIDCGSAKAPDIVAILEAARCRVSTVPLAAANGHDLSDAGAVVISGGPLLFTDPGVAATLYHQLAFVDRLAQPVLGICLGHQGLGARAGAQVSRGPQRRCAERIVPCEDHPLFAGLPHGCFPMTADHCEGITLPRGWRLLASSDHYPVEAMASERRPHLGVQFHPEVSGEPGRRLLHNFCRLAREYAGQ